MTGPWLIVKWVGIAILSFYMAVLVVAILRFRGKLSRLRFGLWMPIVAGNFIGLSVPFILEQVVVTRVCFVVAQVIYLYGLAVLVKAIAHPDEVLLKADGGELTAGFRRE